MAHEFFALPPKIYTYEQIPSNGFIRLLTLEAGFKDRPLRGSLKHVHIDKLPRYEALSYCWGSPDKPRSIELDDETINITESLYSALVRLRRLTKSRLIWADALCINQDDNREKNHQILLMRQIYSSAFRTLAYLGDEADGSDSAIQLHEQIGGISFSALPEKSVTMEWLHSHGLPQYQDPVWLAWSIFWRRPWFRRAWVLQEFVLGKDIVIICGQKKINWRRFVSATEKMQEFNLLKWTTTGGDTDIGIEDAYSGAAAMLAMMASTLQQLDSHKSLAEKLPGLKDTIMMLRKDPSMVEPTIRIFEENMGAFGLSELNDPTIHQPLINLLFMFDRSEATDPRDRLFALLGLASDGSDEDFRPDYNESVNSVARRFSLGFIEKGHGMQVLHLAGLRDDLPSWPSWVPDWTRTGVVERRVLCARTIWAPVDSTSYKAGGDLAPKIRIIQEPSLLLVSGSRVDRVSQLGMDVSSITSASADIFMMKQFFANADEIINPGGSPSMTYGPTGETMDEVYWRTLIANKGMNSAEATEDYAVQYEECRRFFDSNTLDSLTAVELLLSLNLYYGCIGSLLSTSRVCATEKGFVGLAPIGAKVGDLVVVFGGGAMPFVLRQSGESEGSFRLVGGCYVHGLMRGEAVRSPTWEEEDFSLH
ncbi:heterokaryon incompatibility protein-domain-containing protein [Cadophora sp. MPI-SDFR-AT-0126]|nr:heterokaryon incompatibility protein-domain-containing protein [Leotiomycetes sp. MPI-SDFR-AT-0126]